MAFESVTNMINEELPKLQSQFDEILAELKRNHGKKKDFLKNPSNLEWREIDGTFTFEEALKKAEEIGDGWRVPTLKELWYSINRNIEEKSDMNFWTNQDVLYSNAKGKIWGVKKSGYSSWNEKGSELYLKLVRGKSFYENIQFERDGDFIKDLTNGLMWSDQTSENRVNWKNAIEHCKKCQKGGYSDWRLPTIEELFSITDQRKTSNPFVNKMFKNVKSDWYWSHSISKTHSSGSWVLGFYYGSVYWDDQTNSYFAVCVRDL
jgi:hypothetical protein